MVQTCLQPTDQRQGGAETSCPVGVGSPHNGPFTVARIRIISCFSKAGRLGRDVASSPSA